MREELRGFHEKELRSAHGPQHYWKGRRRSDGAFEAEALASTNIQAKSLSQAWVVSKGVNRRTGSSEEGMWYQKYPSVDNFERCSISQSSLGR